MDSPSKAAGKAAVKDVNQFENFNFRAPVPGIIKIHIDLRPKWSLPQISSTPTKPAAVSSKRLALGDFTNRPREGPLFNPEDLPRDSIFEQVVRSTSIMASRDGTTQSGIWVSPRIFISALLFKQWNTGRATQAECQVVYDQGISFLVENEICPKLLDHAYSDRIKLIGFEVDDDIGIFRMEDGYPDRADWVPVESLVEPDEATEYGVAHGTAVACVGYCGSASEADTKAVGDAARQQLSQKLDTLIHKVPPLDFDEITKPGMKSVGSGSLVAADRQGDRVKYGVTVPLWYGSSGGPCVLLDGPRAGQIIGLVWGSSDALDPYNVVTGIAKGLKTIIKGV